MDSSYFAPGTGGSGVTALNGLTDVDADAPNDNDLLVYNAGTGNWEAEAPAAPVEQVVGLFETQTPVIGNYHHPKGVSWLGQQNFGLATASPLIFDADASISKLGINVPFNPPIAAGGNAEGVELRLFIYEANEAGLPATLVTGSEKLRIAPPDYVSPPAGAFTSQNGMLSWTLPSAVTLTAGTRYWIGGAVQSVQDPYGGGQPPVLSFGQHSGIGVSPTGEDGIPESATAFFGALSSVWMQQALNNESWTMASALPATITPGGGIVSGHGAGLFVAALVAAPGS